MRGDLRSEAEKGSGVLPAAGKEIFASGEEILPVFYPKSTFPKGRETRMWVQQSDEGGGRGNPSPGHNEAIN